MWPVVTMKRLLDTGADDARDDHEPTRHKSSDDTVDDTVPMAQEPSSGFWCETFKPRSNPAMLTEAEKAVKRAKLKEERRVAKRASATPNG